eukprot:CAMPEP_0115061112 /NCGR_PEP_ID=MMETSP0227-20121206/7827_1 /TAXON_ID=89957 /ORGANISM="Polarella glacialis, Strain CCMP 1383" /LENGTH=296 /DNA_ID=CAMNT_0002446379 /DNA_START=41 /DNA_END=931 /DNA_ORIENTATION=-
MARRSRSGSTCEARWTTGAIGLALGCGSAACFLLSPSALFCAPVGSSAIQSRGVQGAESATRVRGQDTLQRPSPEFGSLGVASFVAAAALVVAAGRLRSTSGAARGATALSAFENELGVQAPVGYFDPLGFCKDGDFEGFYYKREAELKNGRVAMFATIGYIVPQFWKFPGFLSPTLDITFKDVPNGLAALGKVPPEGWLQIIAWCGMYEIVINEPKHPSEGGNYYKGRFGIFPGRIIADPEKRKKSLNSELANSRLAMVAIIGMWFQDGLTGSAWGDWALYTDSPLRASKNELTS